MARYTVLCKFGRGRRRERVTEVSSILQIIRYEICGPYETFLLNDILQLCIS